MDNITSFQDRLKDVRTLVNSIRSMVVFDNNNYVRDVEEYARKISLKGMEELLLKL